MNRVDGGRSGEAIDVNYHKYELDFRICPPSLALRPRARVESRFILFGSLNLHRESCYDRRNSGTHRSRFGLNLIIYTAAATDKFGEFAREYRDDLWHHAHTGSLPTMRSPLRDIPAANLNRLESIRMCIIIRRAVAPPRFRSFPTRDIAMTTCRH